MLGDLFGGSESRSTPASSLFAMGMPMPSTLTSGGVSINQDTAFRVGAVYAAIRLISDAVSTMPLNPYIRDNGERKLLWPRPVWVDTPEPDRSVGRSDHYQAVLVSMLTDGNAFTRIIRSQTSGEVLALTVLDPKRVEVRREYDRGPIVFIVDGRYTVAQEDMIHVRELCKPEQLRGVSRIGEMRETLGLSAALEQFASTFFGGGSTMGGVIEYPGELTKEQADGLQDSVEKSHRGLRKAHRPGVLSGGAKWVKTSVDPDEAQMLGSREFSLEEIARVFKIPPAMLGSQKPGSQAYASREQDAIQFVTYTLLPYITKIEEAYGWLLPKGAFLKFNVDALLRASLTERYSAYSQGVQAGFLTINDIHRLEDMRAVEGGDQYRVPLTNVNLSAANITETQMRVAMAQTLINAGFEPAAALRTAGLPPMPHTGLPSVQLQQDPGLAGA